MSRRPLRIAIVGYGIAGLAAALLLRRQGHEIAHFEQAAAPAFGGAGLLLQRPGLAVLARLGLLDNALDRGVRINRIIGRTRDGRPVMDLRYDLQHADGIPFRLGLQRGALFDLLDRADDRNRATLRHLTIEMADPDTSALSTHAGEKIGPFDLIVGADGAGSRIRSAVAGNVRRDRLSPWSAAICLLDAPETWTNDCVSQHFDGAEHLSIWPVGSLTPDAPKRINLSWRLGSDGVQALADLRSWKRQIANLCPGIAPLLDQITDAREVLTARYRDVQLRRYREGRVVLIGDAAHAMSPQLGMGASLALGDAAALADALADQVDLDRALDHFDRKRRAEVVRYQRLSRIVTPIFQSGDRRIVAFRDRAFYSLSRLPLVERTLAATLSGRA